MSKVSFSAVVRVSTYNSKNQTTKLFVKLVEVPQGFREIAGETANILFGEIKDLLEYSGKVEFQGELSFSETEILNFTGSIKIDDTVIFDNNVKVNPTLTLKIH